MINILVLDNDYYFGKCIEKIIKVYRKESLFYIGQLFSYNDFIDTNEREQIDILITNTFFYHKLIKDFPAHSPKTFLLVTGNEGTLSEIKEKQNIQISTLTKPLNIDIFYKILDELVKRVKDDQMHISDSSTQKMDFILQYIHENVEKELSLNFLAQRLHYSPSYFSKLFKDYTGQTLTKYITTLRIKRACMLLETTDYQIQEIAELSGIPKVNTFDTLFKTHKGMSPSQYRNQYITYDSSKLE